MDVPTPFRDGYVRMSNPMEASIHTPFGYLFPQSRFPKRVRFWVLHLLQECLSLVRIEKNPRTCLTYVGQDCQDVLEKAWVRAKVAPFFVCTETRTLIYVCSLYITKWLQQAHTSRATTKQTGFPQEHQHTEKIPPTFLTYMIDGQFQLYVTIMSSALRKIFPARFAWKLLIWHSQAVIVDAVWSRLARRHYIQIPGICRNKTQNTHKHPCTHTHPFTHSSIHVQTYTNHI